MAVQLPLSIPVTITERRNYTVKVNLCDVSAQIDPTKIQARAFPAFNAAASIWAFRSSVFNYPELISVAPGEGMANLKVTETRPYYLQSPPRTEVFPVLNYQVYTSLRVPPISLSTSYSNKTLFVVIPFGASLPAPYVYPSDYLQYGQFSATYTPQAYQWYVNIVQADGTYSRLVDFSPITMTGIVAQEEDLRRRETTLQVCSTSVT